jgi:hypothetical protein
MSWYAAHLIQYFKYREGRQRSFVVWENVVLVRARNAEEACAKAEQIGREEEAIDDDSVRVGGHPAKLVFAGVRKVVLCVDPDRRPGDGTEVSYTEMVLPSEKAVHQLAAGEPVAVRIDDGFPDELPATDAPRRRGVAGRTGGGQESAETVPDDLTGLRRKAAGGT